MDLHSIPLHTCNVCWSVCFWRCSFCSLHVRVSFVKSCSNVCVFTGQRTHRDAHVKWTIEVDRYDFTTGPECEYQFCNFIFLMFWHVRFVVGQQWTQNCIMPAKTHVFKADILWVSCRVDLGLVELWLRIGSDNAFQAVWRVESGQNLDTSIGSWKVDSWVGWATGSISAPQNRVLTITNQTLNDGVAHSKNPRKCAYHVTFDLDLDLEHTLDAGSPGDHPMQVWWWSGHLPGRISDFSASTKVPISRDLWLWPWP